MVKKEDYSWCSTTIENLKQKVLVEHLADIDLDNDIDLYDKIISEFVSGNLDDVFDCPACFGLKDIEKKGLLKEGHKYLSLCFSNGDINNWVESIDGVSLGNYELICMKILNNYNFVLEQLKKNRIHALDRLINFRKYNFGVESSTVEQLRWGFYSAEALDEVLAELNIKDGEYSRFSDEHMSILCDSPEGVLYTFDEKRKPILYRLSDIQFLFRNKMEELDIDETDENYFRKVVSMLSMEYSDELFAIVSDDEAIKGLK